AVGDDVRLGRRADGAKLCLDGGGVEELAVAVEEALEVEVLRSGYASGPLRPMVDGVRDGRHALAGVLLVRAQVHEDARRVVEVHPDVLATDAGGLSPSTWRHRAGRRRRRRLVRQR